MEEEVFTYRISKDDKVFICWHGKQVMILKGKEAQRFISKTEILSNKVLQLLMAKVTGNFKRGNER
jgi:hypothetical protein